VDVVRRQEAVLVHLNAIENRISSLSPPDTISLFQIFAGHLQILVTINANNDVRCKAPQAVKTPNETDVDKVLRSQ
jgi:hypothetical protein